MIKKEIIFPSSEKCKECGQYKNNCACPAESNLASDAVDKDSIIESQEHNRTETVAGVNFLSRNGKIKSFIGAVAIFNFECRVCVKIDGQHSFWKQKFDGEIFQEKLNLSEILFKDIGSREFFKPWTGERLKNFIDAKQAAAIEETKQPETTGENNMPKKKTKTEKVKTPKAGGKIAFVDELLLAGKHTKADVAAQLAKKFEVPEKTAKNTVSWAASTMKKRTGKVSNHLPSERAVKAEKPAKKKAVKKSAPKKKSAKVEAAPETAAE